MSTSAFLNLPAREIAGLGAPYALAIASQPIVGNSYCTAQNSMCTQYGGQPDPVVFLCGNQRVDSLLNTAVEQAHSTSTATASNIQPPLQLSTCGC